MRPGFHVDIVALQAEPHVARSPCLSLANQNAIVGDGVDGAANGLRNIQMKRVGREIPLVIASPILC